MSETCPAHWIENPEDAPPPPLTLMYQRNSTMFLSWYWGVFM